MCNFHLWYAAALALIVTVMASSASAAQTVHHYEWEIKYFKFSPDCNATGSKDVLGVYQILPVEIPLETFPGPTVRAKEGDRIEVTVTNKITKPNADGVPAERVSIHWHGIDQKGSQGSDGAAGLTECGIPPNGFKVYNFTVERAGTYFWHGHSGLQRSAGLYGLLIVDQRDGALVPTYDGEFAITLGDWWHADVYNQTNGLDSSQDWTWVGNPQSFLIKGDQSSTSPCLSRFSCPSAELQCNTGNLTSTITGAGTLIWNVLPGRTYLVRMASATSSAFLNFVIEGHEMTVLEADSHRIQPFNTTTIDILSGQTYTFKFTTKPEYPQQRVYHVGVNARDQLVDSKPKGTNPGLAVLSYDMPYINRTVKPSSTNASLLWQYEPQIQLGGPRYNDPDFGAYFASRIRAEIGYSYPAPKSGTVNISLLISQINITQINVGDIKNGSRMRWALNNVSYDTSHENTSLLARLAENPGLQSTANSIDWKQLNLSDIKDARRYDKPLEAIQGGYYKLETGDVVTVILQNAAMYNKTTSEAHPWHLHGHDFWVLGYGTGLYDPDTSPDGFNLDDPPVRNTVPVFGLGWVAIRFIADNPGVWNFHCHNEMHAHLGMMVVFAYGVPSVDAGQIAQCN